MTVSTPRSFAELISDVVARHADREFLPRRDGRGDATAATTYASLGAEIDSIALGLLARGLGHGDRVGLISENRAEWLACDLACASLGIVDVPRGTDTPVEELVFILGHSGCRFAFVETPGVARELARRRAELPELGAICVLHGAASDTWTDLAGLCDEGRKLAGRRPGALAEARERVSADDLLTIVYTSGTTANPKGVMLSHANVLSNVVTVADVLGFRSEDVFLSVLPAWHAYERVLDYVAMWVGARIVYSDRRRLKDDLRGVAPTVFAAVPRIWEMIFDGIHAHVRKMRRPSRRLLELVLDNARRVGSGRAGPLDRALHALLRRTVLPRFCAATGGRLRIAVSGGGSLPNHVDEGLIGIGVPLLNGYGLTETSPVVCVRLPSRNRPGTIGPPLPGTEIEIRSEHDATLPTGATGLIWIRGPQVMRGYYRNEESTAHVLRDGWFNSGDLGHVRADGDVCITGRAKDTIVLAGGENVEPERVEAQLKLSPLIEQAVVVGQDRKVLGAILVPNVDFLAERVPRAEWDERDGVLRGSTVSACVRAELDRLVTRANGFRPVERIAVFRVVVDPMTTENGLLTQTLKVRRHRVGERHAHLIDEMFETSRA